MATQLLTLLHSTFRQRWVQLEAVEDAKARDESTAKVATALAAKKFAKKAKKKSKKKGGAKKKS